MPFVLFGGVLFAACITVGCVAGFLNWWLPRRRLNRLFAERGRERRAEQARVVRLPARVEPMPTFTQREAS